MAVEEEEREGRGGKGRRVKWRGRRERKRGWNGNGKRNGGVRRLGFGRLGSLAWQTSFGFFFFPLGNFGWILPAKTREPHGREDAVARCCPSITLLTLVLNY